jgi:hypothetical protein
LTGSAIAARRLSLAAALLPALWLAGCKTVDRSFELVETTILPVTAGDAMDVPAPILAEAMVRAGYDREYVLRHGAAVHQALATSGGAQVREGQMVSAMFAIQAEQLYVISRERGTFVMEVGDNDCANECD